MQLEKTSARLRHVYLAKTRTFLLCVDRLRHVSCIEHPSLPRQFLENLNFIQLKRQGQQNRLLILGLVAFDPKLESSFPTLSAATRSLARPLCTCRVP